MICIPELNCWLNKLYFESVINEGKFCFPSFISLSDWGVENSIINLLFNECTKQTIYDHLFHYIPFSSITSDSLQTRLSTIRTATESAGIYVCDAEKYQLLYADSTAYNCFNITEEETQLLNELLFFRMTGTHDSTSFINIDYSALQSNLSKMIYLYITLLVDQDVSLYDNQTSLCNENRLIEICFEKYLIDSCYKIISRRCLNLDTTANIVVSELKSYCSTLTLTSTDATTNTIVLPYKPFDNNLFILIYNGEIKHYETDYNIVLESGSYYITWVGLNFQNVLFENDKVFIIYPYF